MMKAPKEEQSFDLHKDLPQFSSEPPPPAEQGGLLAKMKDRLQKTKQQFIDNLYVSLAGDRELDEDLFDEIEERLLAADLGVSTTRKILNFLEAEFKAGEIKNERDAYKHICCMITLILSEKAQQPALVEDGPTVFLLVGVNGAGKTTSLGKLASYYATQGKKVLVVAGDTFRAAAVEQLTEWSTRVGVDIFAKTPNADQGALVDPSAVMFEAAAMAKGNGYDIILCDTSGRLHTKHNLMDELAKMKRSLHKNIPGAPHHTLLVLDATGGQNAILQTQSFLDTVDINGVILTKLDSTAKGGVLVGIVNEFDLPIYFIGLGEKTEDLQPFNARQFADSILGE